VLVAVAARLLPSPPFAALYATLFARRAQRRAPLAYAFIASVLPLPATFAKEKRALALCCCVRVVVAVAVVTFGTLPHYRVAVAVSSNDKSSGQ